MTCTYVCMEGLILCPIERSWKVYWSELICSQQFISLPCIVPCSKNCMGGGGGGAGGSVG